MQENRSFDHVFGTLRGVRGFNDPRAVTLPDGKPVWLQTNAAGQTYAPFRLNIKETKATWMGSLPHSWRTRWMPATKASTTGGSRRNPPGHKEFARMPLTLGLLQSRGHSFLLCAGRCLHRVRPELLFFADRDHAQPAVPVDRNDSGPAVDPRQANVRNSDVDYDSEVSWNTFPERLEDAGHLLGIYQNELSLPTGLRRRRRPGWRISPTIRSSGSPNTMSGARAPISGTWRRLGQIGQARQRLCQALGARAEPAPKGVHDE